MSERLKDGSTAYYWAPQRRDTAAGFRLHAEALGHDYGPATARAGDIRTTWGGIGHGIEVRLIAPAATTSPTPPEIKPPTRRSRLRYGARIGAWAA